MSISQNVEKAANAAAAVSIPAWLTSLVADWLPVVQFGAGVLAIVASLFAIVIHIQKLRDK